MLAIILAKPFLLKLFYLFVITCFKVSLVQLFVKIHNEKVEFSKSAKCTTLMAEAYDKVV